MPRLKRPHTPLAVRCVVVERQLHQLGMDKAVATMRGMPTLRERLDLGLRFLFAENDRPHLDHEPALCLRRFNKRTGMYSPDANDPDYLVYRSALEHKVKTLVRGDGAQYSDRALLKRKRRRMKKDLAILDQLGATLQRWSTTRKRRWPKRKMRGRSTWPKRPLR